LIADRLARFQYPIAPWFKEVSSDVDNFKSLSNTITQLAEKSEQQIVLLIDEVDKSSNNQLFLSFLGILRDKYLLRNEVPTFHSVVLVGVHDVKTLKLKIRPEENEKYNSPWNIAADFKVDLSFHPHEIVPMLQAYAVDRGINMDFQAIAEHLFYHTSGYPFLVSKICKMLDEELSINNSTWNTEDIDFAVSKLVKETNTNFESLIKNLEEFEGLYNLVFAVLISGQRIPFNIQVPDINLGLTYGVFGTKDQLSIHNRIYSELIYNYMSVKLQIGLSELDDYTYPPNYVLPGNRLNMPALLLKFQEFMKGQYSRKDRDFLERHARLLFLAFLKPILNGSGHDFKEPQISEERRLDVTITFFQHKYIVELKIWRGEVAHQTGLQQLAEYLEREQINEGYLIVFDHQGIKSWGNEQYEMGGKQIMAVWV
jgi:hypothetical protein